MSFDLYVFDNDQIPTGELLYELLVADVAPDVMPTPRIAGFLSELDERWPGLDEGPDGSPWSSWPLWQPVAGDGCAFNIGWSFAEAMYPLVLEAAGRHGLHAPHPPSGQYVRSGRGGWRQLGNAVA